MNDNERINLTEPAAPEETMDAVRGILRAPENPADWSWRKNFPEQPEAQRELVRIDAKQSVGEPLRLVNKRILLEDSVRIATKVECIHCTIEIFKSGAVDIGEDGALWLKHCDVRGGGSNQGRMSLADMLSATAGNAEGTEEDRKEEGSRQLSQRNDINLSDFLYNSRLLFADAEKWIEEDNKRGGSRQLPQQIVLVNGALHVYDTQVHDLTLSNDGNHRGWAVRNNGVVRLVDTDFVRCKGNMINDEAPQEDKFWFDASVYGYRVCTQEFEGNFFTGYSFDKLFDKDSSELAVAITVGKHPSQRATFESCTFAFSPCWDMDTHKIQVEPFVKLYYGRLCGCTLRMTYGEGIEESRLTAMAKAAFSMTEGAPCLALVSCQIESCAFEHCTNIDVSSSSLRACRFNGCAHMNLPETGRTELRSCAFSQCGSKDRNFFECKMKERWIYYPEHLSVKNCCFTDCTALNCILELSFESPDGYAPKSVIISGNLFRHCTAPSEVIHINCMREYYGFSEKEWEGRCILKDNRFEECDCANYVIAE